MQATMRRSTQHDTTIRMVWGIGNGNRKTVGKSKDTTTTPDRDYIESKGIVCIHSKHAFAQLLNIYAKTYFSV